MMKRMKKQKTAMSVGWVLNLVYHGTSSGLLFGKQKDYKTYSKISDNPHWTDKLVILEQWKK